MDVELHHMTQQLQQQQQQEVYGGFQGHGGTPSYYHFFRIFHEIIHPAIGVPSILGSLHIASVEHIINHNGGYTD